jgi:ubiquinone/menaquinone biosynthesis C-methylase UbiE
MCALMASPQTQGDQALPAHVNTSVPAETWKQAQVWERDFWFREQRNLKKYGKNYAWRLLSLLGRVEKYRGDDNNQWWAKQFENYSFLPRIAENVIEVGCGPYTNVRLVRKACQPKYVFLSDPLIRTYVNFPMTMVRELHRSAGAYLDDHALEDLPFRDAYFDVAVMINVLDHVQDAHACMRSLLRILKPGGYVIIGQDLTNEEDFRTHPDGMRTGHPITLEAPWFDPYVAEFEPLVQKILSREDGRTPQWHHATFLFAGTKKNQLLH